MSNKKYDYKPVESIVVKPIQTPPAGLFFYTPDDFLHPSIRVLRARLIESIHEYRKRNDGRYPKYVTVSYEDWHLLRKCCPYPLHTDELQMCGVKLLRSHDVKPGTFIFSEETII